MRKFIIGFILALTLLAIGSLFVIRLDTAAAIIDARYKSEASRFVVLDDGTRMHYLDHGNVSTPVLVLVHGSYDSAYTWELIIPELKDVFRIIAPDLPAHGLTGKTVADKYNVSGAVETLHSFFGKIGLKRFHLGGSSFGGNIAWRYALDHPDRVDRLILIDAAGYPGLKPLTRNRNNPLIRLLYRYGNPTRLVRAGMEKAVVDKKIVTDKRVERSVDFLRRRGSRDAHRIRAQTRKPDDQPIDDIPNIKAPTLIVWGAKDAMIKVADAKRFHRDLPNSQLVIYHDLGHLPHLEAPQRVASELRRFLRH